MAGIHSSGRHSAVPSDLRIIRRPITPQEKQSWSELAQFLILVGLMESSRWQAKDIVFHGGTSLHLAWASPRFSEDLDFLLNDNLLTQMGKTMQDVVTHMERFLLRIDAGLKLSLKDTSSERMGRFAISISKEGVLGKAVVKSEFWGVPKDYLDGYESMPRTPIPPAEVGNDSILMRLRAQLPSATLNSIFCDKIVAMAGRPYVKWRDIFDLWWISQQCEFKSPDQMVLAKRIQTYARAYRFDPNDSAGAETALASGDCPARTMAKRLRDYVERISEPELLPQAASDLQRFMFPCTGQANTPDWQVEVKRMISHAVEVASSMANLIDGLQLSEVSTPVSPEKLRVPAESSFPGETDPHEPAVLSTEVNSMNIGDEARYRSRMTAR